MTVGGTPDSVHGINLSHKATSPAGSALGFACAVPICRGRLPITQGAASAGDQPAGRSSSGYAGCSCALQAQTCSQTLAVGSRQILLRIV